MNPNAHSNWNIPTAVSSTYRVHGIRFSSLYSRSRILSVIIVIAAGLSRIDTLDLIVAGLGLTFRPPLPLWSS